MRRRRWVGVLLVAMGAASVLPSGTSAGAAVRPVYGDATAYGVNAAHDGHPAGAAVRGLNLRWSRDFGAPVSYPLIVGNRIFVTVRHLVGYGTDLYALDATTGRRVWGPIDLGGVYYFGGLTYDRGHVFTVNYDGQVRSFDAETGIQAWSIQLSQYSFTSAPTAVDGVVYIGGAGTGGTLYAVDGRTGSIRWSAPVANGDSSSPAVDGTSVYVSYACEQAYSFSTTGALNWHHATGCAGGGGRTPVLHNSEVWVRDVIFDPARLNAATGTQTGTFAAGPMPAFSGSLGFFVDRGRLSATDVNVGGVRWSTDGDGGLVTSPVTSGRLVFVGSSTGRVFGWNIDTGAQVWSGDAGAPILGPDEQNAFTPQAMAIGGGVLAVPATNTLTVFAPQ